MEDELLKKRIIELAERAYSTGIYTYTPFFGLAEQDILHRVNKEISHVPRSSFGGAPGCERVVFRFGDETLCGYEQVFPIACIKAVPASQKFADALTHRDILGALMSLGIDRSQTGDILIQDNTAYIFCIDRIASYIADNLTSAKHTVLKCSIVDSAPECALFQLSAGEIIISSERVDAVAAKFCKLSRSAINEQIRLGKLFINGKCCSDGSRSLNAGDIVSVRGVGRFIYTGAERRTKSGKIVAKIEKYE